MDVLPSMLRFIFLYMSKHGEHEWFMRAADLRLERQRQLRPKFGMGFPVHDECFSAKDL